MSRLYPRPTESEAGGRAGPGAGEGAGRTVLARSLHGPDAHVCELPLHGSRVWVRLRDRLGPVGALQCTISPLRVT